MSNTNPSLKIIANEFLAMSQKGTVVFHEETVIEEMIHYFWKTKNKEAALRVADLGIQLHPYSSNMLFSKAELLYLNKQLSDALVFVEKMQALQPNDVHAQLLKVRIYIDMGRYDQAMDTLDLIDQDSVEEEDISNVYLCYAAIYDNLDKHKEMFKALCSALATDLDNEDILERMGLCVEFSMCHEEQVKFLEYYLLERPYSSLAWFHLGHSYWYLNQPEKAVDSFEYAFITDKFFNQAYIDCADVLLEMGLYERAIDCFEDGLVHCEDDVNLYIGKGKCLFKLENYEQALSVFLEVTSIQKDSADALYHVGLCYTYLGCPLPAIDYLERASKLDKKREEFAAALGEAYYLNGSTEMAANYFDKAIELAPEVSEYWIRYITFLMNEGLFEEAFENISAAFMNTYGTELKYCHAAYCFKIGDRKEGMNVLLQAIMENYEMHISFFELCPDLANDLEIVSLVEDNSPF